MLFANILLILSGVVSVILILLILLSNAKKITNRTLALFIFSILLWLVANLFTNVSANPYTSLIFARLTLIGATLLPYTFLMFCYAYRDQIITKSTKKKLQLLIILPIVILLTTPTSLNVVSIKANGIDTRTGQIYYLLIFEILIYFFIALRSLYLYYRSTKITSLEKAQLRYIFLGVILTLIPGIITNAILPSLHQSNAVFYGPNIVIILALFTSIAIIRHGLLDIRLIVARSVAYIFTLAAVVVIYVTPTILITNHLLHAHLSQSTVILLVLVTCLVAILFQFLRDRFNKFTNKLFFQDYYDVQDVLDRLGNLLVGSVNPVDIEAHSVTILSDAIKPTYLEYLLVSGHKTAKRAELLDELMKNKSNIVVFAELDSNRNDSLHRKLSENEVGVAVRLRTKDEYLGFIILGYKRSGLIYSDTDKRLLAIAADEIAISLQNALRFEEIENFNLTLQTKVNEATSKLRLANEKLRALDETKDDFISMASHQLRTPLTSVKGYISMVLDGDAGQASKLQKEMLGQAFASSQRMVYLIADLLNVSRLKTGKFVIEPTPVDLSTIVEQELGQLQETAASRSLTLVYDKPKSFPALMIDETKTRQVIMNFIDNAIYYTPSGGQIAVKLVDKPGTVELRVEDNGIGVPKSEQHHLFTKFFRAGNARKARPDGTGLGLFMAKKVIIAEGGSIIFESQENKGSTFGFIFSKAKLTAHSSPNLSVKAEPKSVTPTR